jgi:hypothetical protein
MEELDESVIECRGVHNIGSLTVSGPVAFEVERKLYILPDGDQILA